MRQKRIIQLLATHADTLVIDPASAGQICLGKKAELEVGPLFSLAEKLQQTMKPIQPRTPFVRELKNDLAHRAQRRMATNRRMKNVFVIGAAITGALLSVASVVGAIVLLIKTLHQRTQRRALLSAPHA